MKIKIQSNATSYKGDLRKYIKGVYEMHIKAVLENIRNHVCAECGYAASMKSNLKQHIELFHEKIRILDL